MHAGRFTYLRFREGLNVLIDGGGIGRNTELTFEFDERAGRTERN